MRQMMYRRIMAACSFVRGVAGAAEREVAQRGELRLYGFGYSESNPSALKFPITSRARSSLVNATFAIAGTSMPCADSSTISARRQVTTDPLPGG